jgi:hypothetical protein
MVSNTGLFDNLGQQRFHRLVPINAQEGCCKERKQQAAEEDYHHVAERSSLLKTTTPSRKGPCTSRCRNANNDGDPFSKYPHGGSFGFL